MHGNHGSGICVSRRRQTHAAISARHFYLVPADTNTLVHHELRQRNVELVITPTSTLNLEGDLNVEVLFDDKFVVMAGAESKWARRGKLMLTELINERWILPPADSLPGASIAQAFRATGLEPPRAHMISFSLPLHHHLLATGEFLDYASGVNVALRQTLAAQTAVSRDKSESSPNRDRNLTKSHAQPAGAGFY